MYFLSRQHHFTDGVTYITNHFNVDKEVNHVEGHCTFRVITWRKLKFVHVQVRTML